MHTYVLITRFLTPLQKNAYVCVLEYTWNSRLNTIANAFQNASFSYLIVEWPYHQMTVSSCTSSVQTAIMPFARIGGPHYRNSAIWNKNQTNQNRVCRKRYFIAGRTRDNNRVDKYFNKINRSHLNSFYDLRFTKIIPNATKYTLCIPLNYNIKII